MQILTLGVMRLIGVTLAGSCLHSPLSWSPDGQWLVYAVQEPHPGLLPESGWLFAPARVDRPAKSISAVGPGGSPVPAARFKLWANDRATGRSVMLEESEWPISAAGWSSDGRRLAFLRIVLDAHASTSGQLRGRCELIVQEALDRKQVVLTLLEPALPHVRLDDLPSIRPSWSPDGQAILVARPGSEPAILIVDPIRRHVRKTLVGAEYASWSPEGTRLAVVSPSDEPFEQIVQILGSDFRLLRTIKGFGLIAEPPTWSSDGQSILLAGRRPQTRFPGLELIRVQADSGVSSPLLPFVSLPGTARPYGSSTSIRTADPSAPVPRASLAFDRDLERCAFAADLPGQDPVIGFCNIRVPQTFKRFPPIDAGFRIGVLAMHPDGQLVAVRIEGAGRTGPTFLCDLGSEEVTPLAPDEPALQEWLATLAGGASSVLKGSLPQASAEGHKVERDNLLPIAGEIPMQNQALGRLKRLGKVGRDLVRKVGTEPNGGATASIPSTELDEYRLFFDVLAGDYRSACADLDDLANGTSSPEMRLRFVAARAQLLHAEGEVDHARTMVDYLLSAQRRESMLVEETPAGNALSLGDDPFRGWLLYLRDRLKHPVAGNTDGLEKSDADAEDEVDLRLPGPLRGPQGMGLGGQFRPRFVPLGQVPNGRPRLGEPRGRGAIVDPLRPLAPRGVFPPLPPRPFQPGNPTTPRPRADRRF